MTLDPNSSALLEQLRDVHAPAFPHYWPPAPGWWVLLFVIVITLCLSSRWLIQRQQDKRYRLSILGLFDGLAKSDLAHVDPSRFAAEVSSLLRRVALARYSNEQVATLEGVEWLAFLDRTGGNDQFSNGPGQVLADGPYQPQAELDAYALVNLAKNWVRRNSV